MNWNICTSEGNPTILLPEGTEVPEGYTVEAQTANPNYLVDLEASLGRRITVLAFRNRFTQTEKITMDLASLDNPSDPLQKRQIAAAIRVSTADSSNASFIDLDRPDTRAGVMAFETFGVIGAGRALQILDAPVQAEEVPIR